MLLHYCSYDDIHRFKKSATTAAFEVSDELSGISDASHGLIQVIADKADISFQNGNFMSHNQIQIV